MDIDWQAILGGLGLFLFGIKFMGDGLKSLAGDKLRDIIDKYTSKPWMGLIIGILVTVFIQSSSATTAITIGFVRAGLMRLDQTVGIIFGANIGTTITAFLVGLKVEKYSLFFIFVGAMMLLFSKRKKQGYIGEITLGFGMLFYGLMLMGDALKVLKDIQAFHDLTIAMSAHPWWAVGGGIIMTGVIQSSSAMIGIVQKIYESGGMPFAAALPFVFGSNIGTTITAALAAMGGSLASRRAAGIHTLFNVLMTIIAMLMLPLYLSLFAYLTGRFGIEPMMQIAVAHIIFNLVGTILFYPFIKQMVWIIKKTIRGDEKERIDINTEDFDSGLAHDLPTAALGVAKRATLKMGEISTEVIETAKQYLNKENKVNLDSISQLEDIINNFDTKITDYLLLISKEKLNEDDIEQNSINLQIVKNLERIGDLTMNLGEFFDLVYDARESFSQQALDEINNMFDLVIHMLNRSLKIYEHNDFSLLQSVKEDETYLDLLESKARNNHFARMRSDECPTTIGGSVYVDILGTLERMGDHAENIARSVFNVHTQHEARRAAEIEEQN
jgi:phosphate:Na+ symporter